MSQLEIKNTCKNEKNIDDVFEMIECLQYIESGSFNKDFNRVRRFLNPKQKFMNVKENFKVGTLIGLDKIFKVLSNEDLIKKSPILKDLYIGKTQNENQTVYRFEFFDCVSGDVVYLEGKENNG